MKEVYKHEFNYWQQLLAMLTTMWRINSDSIDFKWGYFAPRFGLELQLNRGGYFSRNYSINFCLIWGMFKILLPFKTSREESCEYLTYGFNIFANSVIWRWGNYYKSWDLPFVSYVFDFHVVQNTSGEWESGNSSWDNQNILRESYLYTYLLSSGEEQIVRATCFKEIRQWHRKWLPWVKLVKPTISIEFSSEVGERTGSWKGGVLGCSYDLLPDETIEECLKRMELTRKFT